MIKEQIQLNSRVDAVPAIDEMVLNRVGVVCHRRFKSEQMVRAGLYSVLKNITSIFNMLVAKHENIFDGSCLHLVTPLAEGADRIGARQGLNLDYKLHAVLPFPISEYELDFPCQVSRIQFQDLLANASTVKILYGNRDSLESRQLSYQAAAEWLLENIDILIAVWDGEPQIRPGSTGQTITDACAMNIPVIWIDSFEPDKITFLNTFNPTLSTHTELQRNTLKTLEDLISLK